MELEMYRGDYKLIPVKIKKDGADYKLSSNENIYFSLKNHSTSEDYVIQKQLNKGIARDNEKERYIIEILPEDTKNLELLAESVVFHFDIVIMFDGNKPLTQRGILTIKRDITRNEFISQETELTEEQIQALSEITINLDDELSIEYDDNVLDIDFMLEGEDLIVENNVKGIDFNINDNEELEVIYNGN